MTKRRAFTLLEIMIALMLILLASGVISYKMKGTIERKKFTSEIECLRTRMRGIQKMAMATETDWEGVLRKENSGWVFFLQCDEAKSHKFSPFHLAKMEIALDQQKVQDLLVFYFYANGHTSPEGTLSFSLDSHKNEWNLAQLFERSRGEK